MKSRIRAILHEMFAIEKNERVKVAFLTVAFFFVICAYTLAKELGGSIFISIVGKEYIPWAKICTMIFFIPAIFLYSKLVDTVRRYQLLAGYALFFGLTGLMFACLLGHATIGLPNTDTSPYRIFGWLFYFWVEGFTPFVVSVFWAFANSITTPQGAKSNYAIIVAGSKFGGMLSAGFAWALFSWNSVNPAAISDVLMHQLVLGWCSGMLLCVPLVIVLLMKYVPGRFLHGYEAVYKLEKATHQEREGIFRGLLLLLRYPYVLGIFGMVYFYEVVATVVSYLRLGIAQSSAANLSGISSYLYQTIFMTHFFGLLISLFATRTLLRHMGERICLLIIPLASGLLLFYLIVHTTPFSLMLAFVLLKSVNYAFSWPVRESLYIPTVKEIKFKSKSWIDAFGSKFAKSSGSAFNIFASKMAPMLFLPVHSFFFGTLVALWFGTAYALGRRFDTAVANNEVIGD